MQIVVEQELLSAALNNVTRAASSRSPSQALRGILLEAENNTLSLGSSDGDITLKAQFSAQIYNSGKILVPADSFSEIIRRLGSQPLEISLDNTDGLGALLRWSGGETKIWTMDASLYPPLPEGSSGIISLGSELLRKSLSKVLHASSREEIPSKAILRGVHLTRKDGKIQAEATDGIRLAVWQNEIQGDTETFDLVLPLRAVNEFSRLTGREGTITLSYDENHLFARWISEDGTTAYFLAARRSNGKYPNTSGFVPSRYALKMEMKPEKFLAALERAMVINRLDSQTYPIRMNLDIKTAELVLRASSSAVGIQAEKLKVDRWEGESLELAFNAKFLHEGIKVIEGEILSFESAGVEEPVRITGQEKDYFYLLLPLRLG